MYLLGILAAVLVAAAAVYGFVRVPPALQAKILKRVLFGLVAVGVVALVLRGRIDLAFLVGVLLPLINRFRRVPGFGHVGTGTAGQGTAGPANTASEVSTPWLRMRLDHGSGAVDGEVLQGRQGGRRLAALTLAELLELRRECAHDTESVGLIEAFLDRSHAEWRGTAQESTAETAAPAADDSRMTSERACAILGIAPDATPEAIREAHHSLMKRVHPDQGGSDYLASEINAAKDFLLKRR